MKPIYNGFYKELEQLKAEYDDADFGFLENEFAGEEDGKKVYADDFLHGFCDSFAFCLNQEFGYETMAIYDNEGNLVHAYCVKKAGEDIFFIDVRGCTNDFETFVSDFEDWITISEDEPADIRVFEPDQNDLDYTSTATKFIRMYKEYYIPRF